MYLITEPVAYQRRTKIVATLGPATDQPDTMRRLIQAGVNVVRVNFSHGSHKEHLQRMTLVRQVARELKCVVGILGDLQGPKIRIARFAEGKVTLAVGDAFAFDADWPDEAGGQQCVGIDYKQLPEDVVPGDVLLLDDGRIQCEVQSILGSCIHCKITVGGVLSNNKGINRRGGGLTAPALTDKDRADLKFAVLHQVDYLAVSFPRDANDIEIAKQLIKEASGTQGVIAKIERAEAVEHMEAIVAASDGIMVARGDLAVEIGEENVPLAQKEMTRIARNNNKPVIIATQMMESMVESSMPTRAEVSDVANAVLENADAVMLSAETAVGQNPIIVVETMARICVASEKERHAQTSSHRMDWTFERVDMAIAMATMYTANHLDIQAIITLTESGTTPLLMSRIRTAIPVFGLSRFETTLGKMTLYRGVYPIFFDVMQYSRQHLNKEAVMHLKSLQALQDSDRVILTKGDYIGVGGCSNAMKILTVRDAVA